ncbi:MAG: ABC transporter permease, partial [Lachnospiraceae bacterium]|nr:ABC transporter permease [Lachnospiraceae bacterium]
MRKYWEIAKTYTKTQLAWRADVIFNMIFTISKILFAYLLWGIIFQGKEMVGAFTFHGMLSYYIVSSFLSQLEMSDGISREIHYR